MKESCETNNVFYHSIISIISTALQYLWLPVARPPVSCLLTSQLYNIHPGAVKRSIRSAGPSPVFYHHGAAFCAPNFPSQTPLEPQPGPAGWLAGGTDCSPRSLRLAWEDGTRVDDRQRERERERWCLVKHFRRPATMWFSIKLFVPHCLCCSLTRSQQCNAMWWGLSSLQIFSHGLFIHWPVPVPSPMTGLSFISSNVDTFPGSLRWLPPADHR